MKRNVFVLPVVALVLACVMLISCKQPPVVSISEFCVDKQFCKEHLMPEKLYRIDNQEEMDALFPDQSLYSLNDIDFYVDSLDIENVYKALKIGEGHTDFTNVALGYDITHPVTIEIQDSYDGSVNLILVADGIPTRIINSGFSKLSDSTGK